MQHYTKVEVWALAHEIVLDMYRLTGTFPRTERFEITSQLRRAALSAATNIVEGRKRASDKDFAHFLNMSEGSAAEVHYLLLVAIDLGFGDPNGARELQDKATRLQQRLAQFRNRLLRTC